MYFSSTILSDFIDYATYKGADTNALRQEFPIPEGQKHIPYLTVVQILNHIGQELDDESLGLHIGEQMVLKATEQVNSIIQNSETLEDAFQNAAYYSRLISDALDCSLIKNKNSYSVIFEENPNWKVHQSYAKRQILDLTLFSCLNALVTYTGRAYCPTQIYFHTEKPKSSKEYYRLFNCSIQYNFQHTEIVFEKQIFDAHAKEIQVGLLESLKEKIREEIEGLNPENELVYHLKKTILNHKPERILIEVASQKMNLSSRTVQRKLKELGTTFKKIEYELQLNLSKTYLEEGQKSIDEISYLLGFSESSAFIRFFKSLTKLTPKEYKDKVV